MQKYQDVVLDRQGNPVQGASVLVKTYPADGSTPVYATNAVGADVNPVTTDASGRFYFYAPDGRYSLTVSKSGTVTQTITDILIEDPSDGTSPVVMAEGAITVGIDGDDGYASFAGTTVTPAEGALRIRKAEDPRSSEGHTYGGPVDFWIVPYNAGMAIEFKGVVECWVEDFSIHNNNRGGTDHPDPANLWIGDNLDLGGLRISGVVNAAETVQYAEIVCERFAETSHGDMRLIVRGATDGWDFRQGAADADTSKVKILASGRVLVNTEIDGGSNFRVSTSAGAEPNANESTSAATLVSTTTAGVNVGPSLRFMGESGNGVTPYSFGMIQGYKASASAGDYGGGLRFNVITSVGGVVAPMLLTETGINDADIGATSPKTAKFTAITSSSTTATPAGGSTAARLLMGTTAGFGIYYGSGAPSVTAAQGSLYMRSDGSSTSTRMYVNTDGGTTWTAVTTAA